MLTAKAAAPALFTKSSRVSGELLLWSSSDMSATEYLLFAGVDSLPEGAACKPFDEPV
jgi:hypothetical protein